MKAGIALAALSMVAACGSSDGGGADGAVTVKIGKLIPSTGGYVTSGESQDRGFEIALADARTKYAGKLKIEVENFDTGETPQTAIAGYQKARAWGADATIHIGAASPQALAVAEAAKGTIQMANVGSPLKPINPTGFNQFALMVEYQYPLGIQMFYDAEGANLKDAVYVSADIYPVGQAGTKLWQKFLEGKGVKTAAVEQVAGADSNLRALARKIVGLNPSVVLQDVPAPSNVALSTALKREGYQGIVLGGAAQASGALLEGSPGLFENYYAITAWSPRQENQTPTAEAFLKQYSAKYPEGGTPDQYHAYAYNGLTQYLASVAKVGGTDVDKVAEAMRGDGPEGVGMASTSFGKDQYFKMPVSLIKIDSQDAAQVVTTTEGD
jgi:ABC-type branched-subunit amino acid transport system substrate-binding protein